MILDELAAHARKRVQAAMETVGPDEMREAAQALPKGDFRFERALKGDQMAFLCEVKRASPSKGIISADFPFLDIARDYEAAGADCVSCLTEPKWFLGSDDIFRAIRGAVSLPMLRKDFTVHAYQLYEARRMGADAALLICALLDARALVEMLSVCDALGMSALVETHDEAEIRMAVSAGARVIGVNNRNLKTFAVDLSNVARLRALVPPNALFVAESGVQSAEDVAAMRRVGADAVLIGEALMRAPDRRATLAAYRRAAQ